MKIAFNPSTVAALTTPPNNKDITFDLRGQNIFARGVKFCGTDTNTWRDIKINNVSIGSHTLDLRNGSNTTLTNTNGVVTINSTWRPVVDNLTSDSTTSSLSAKQGKVLKALIDGKSDSEHNHDERYVYNYGGIRMDGASVGKNALGMTTNSGVTGDWWHILQAAWNGEYRWNSQIAFPTQNRNGMYYRSGLDDDAKWGSWVKLLDTNNYSGVLDSRYYTESEVNSLLGAKLNRQNLSYGTWNPRGYNLAADYSYNGGDLSISENSGKIYVSINGQFYQNEGQYRVLDTSDVAGLKGDLTVHQYLSNTNTTWWPLIWGGSSHANTSDSTGAVYKSHDKLSWQTSSQTLYTTHLRTTYIDLENNRGIFQVTSGGTSPYKGIRLPTLGADGIGMFSRFSNAGDEGGIIISEDTSVIYNSFDTGWGLTVRDKDRGETNISGDGTIAFGVRQDYRAYSLGGFEKSGSNNSYVLLGGGGHKLESSLNVASASKLLTTRSIWGQSFDGTGNVNGTIYINNSDSENGAIILNNNVNTHARISAIDNKIIFNTGGEIRFGATNWEYSDWAGLKYDTVANAIYLGIADGTVFNYQSNKRSNGTLKFPGITTITPDSGARIGGSGGNLYLGNANNFGWVYVQDMCSQTNTSLWSIRQDGNAIFNYIKSKTNAYIVGNLEAGQIIRGGSSQIWVNGRNGALLRETSVAGYHALWSLKTTNGSWDFGEYNAGSDWNNIPVLSYITDSNYNSGNNAPTYQIKFPLASGTVALTSQASSFDVNTAQYLRSLGDQNCQTGRIQAYGDVYTYNTYNGNTGSPSTYTSVIGFGRGIKGTVEIAGGWCNTHLYWRSLRDCCEDWHSWRTVLDSSNYTEFINNYYWANVKISASSSTTTSPTVSNLTATNSIRMSNISLEHTDEINNITNNGGIHLNYRNSGNISLCQGGGNVGIGTMSPSYKLDVKGQVKASGFIHSDHSINDAVLLAGGGYGRIFMSGTTRYYNNTSYELSFHKLSDLCNNLVWVDGCIWNSTSISFQLSSDFYPYLYANSPSMRTIYRMDGDNMITVDGNGIVIISCSSYPRRVGFFYTGRA